MPRYQIDRTFEVYRTFFTTAKSKEDALAHPENWEQEPGEELTGDVLDTNIEEIAADKPDEAAKIAEWNTQASR